MQNNTQTAAVADYAMYFKLYTVGEHLAHCDMETMEAQYANDWKCDPSLLWPVSDADDVHEVDARTVMKLRSSMTPVTHVEMAKHIGHKFVTVYTDSDGAYWAASEDTWCSEFWDGFMREYERNEIETELAAQAVQRLLEA